ncbi:MAG: sulfatase [Bacteroidia bacterium]|nr:sulfatase [Bacteroidia bacterium]
MRNPLLIIPFILTAVNSEAQEPLKSKKPNVLFIIADDLRPVLGCYGDEYVKTPHIDQLAKTATIFQNSYCNIPVSGASRASLLTGMYPQYPNRFTRFDSFAEKDAPEAKPMSGWFADNGYITISNGKVFHNMTDFASSWSEYPWMKDPNNSGADWAEYNKYELWLNGESGKNINPKTLRGPFYESADRPDDDYEDAATTQRTIDDMKRLSESDKPFFIVNGFRRPHLPFNVPKKYWDLYKREEIPLAENRYLPENLPTQVMGSAEITQYALAEDMQSDEFHRLARHAYFASVSFIDAQIGRLMNALDTLKLTENTIVIIIGDHGWNLGEHTFWGKHNLMGNATKSPLIIRVPGLTKGKTSSSMVEFVDIYPTLCEVTGIEFPNNRLDGKSLFPILKNHNNEVKEFVRVIWENGINIIDENFSYTFWGNLDNPDAEMLYNHKDDKNENKNIASDKPTITTEFKNKFRSHYYKETPGGHK